MAKLFLGNDMIIRFSGAGKLVDDNGDAVAGATVQANLYNQGTSTLVAGVDWPLNLSDDGGGEYSAVLPDTAGIIVKGKYDLVITAKLGVSDALWKKTLTAKYRKFEE